MSDADRFETRLAAAYQRWAAEAPMDVDVNALIENFSVEDARRRLELREREEEQE